MKLLLDGLSTLQLKKLIEEASKKLEEKPKVVNFNKEKLKVEWDELGKEEELLTQDVKFIVNLPIEVILSSEIECDAYNIPNPSYYDVFQNDCRIKLLPVENLSKKQEKALNDIAQSISHIDYNVEALHELAPDILKKKVAFAKKLGKFTDKLSKLGIEVADLND